MPESTDLCLAMAPGKVLPAMIKANFKVALVKAWVEVNGTAPGMLATQ